MARVAQTHDIGHWASQLIDGINALRRDEAMLNTPGATIHEPDHQVREEQAMAAAVAAIKARHYAITGDYMELGYSEIRSLFVVALDAYHAAHQTLRGRS